MTKEPCSFVEMTRQAPIVHECTHAAFDLLRYSHARVSDSEAAAYLAQCLFARTRMPNPDASETRLYSDTPAKDKVLEVAWALAGKLLKGKTPTTEEYVKLESAVMRHPDYYHKWNYSGWNGI